MDRNESDDRLLALGRALSCRVRLSVLQALAAGDASVGELVDHIGASQPNMSNHLAVLRSAGLVTYRRQGRVVRYQLASPEAADLVTSLTTFANAVTLHARSEWVAPMETTR
jgi:DNA-binding transcriptional ArsR family regulator